MNIQQTTELLTRVQIVDNRRVEETTVLAWFELVGDLDYVLAVEAVKLHFRESTSYLQPAHVRTGVERILLASSDREDEWGNPIYDFPARAAWNRAQQQRAVTA